MVQSDRSPVWRDDQRSQLAQSRLSHAAASAAPDGHELALFDVELLGLINRPFVESAFAQSQSFPFLLFERSLEWQDVAHDRPRQRKSVITSIAQLCVNAGLSSRTSKSRVAATCAAS